MLDHHGISSLSVESEVVWALSERSSRRRSPVAYTRGDCRRVAAIVAAIVAATIAATVAPCIHYRQSSPRQTPVYSSNLLAIVAATIVATFAATIAPTGCRDDRPVYTPYNVFTTPITRSFSQPWRTASRSDRYRSSSRIHKLTAWRCQC